jgi:hypothetical protein
MPVVAQLLAGSPKPHRSRVKFHTKKDTMVFQVKAWALGYIPTPLKTSLMRKKNQN